jgi:hypothetical protein
VVNIRGYLEENGREGSRKGPGCDISSELEDKEESGRGDNKEGRRGEILERRLLSSIEEKIRKGI